MANAKIFGWGLLVVGLILVSWTLFSSYNIFTAKSPAPEFFQDEKASLQSEAGGDIQAQLEKMIGEQLQGILPADSVTKLLNLAVWSMLAFLLIFGGTQIAGIGIKLIKS